jgi:hypothetical protein
VSVSRELHAAVLIRDTGCFLHRLDSAHVCHDQWGQPHSAHDLSKLTVDHVHMGGGMMGKRAPDDERSLIAMCAGENIGGPSRVVRQAEREYLAHLYPEVE